MTAPSRMRAAAIVTLTEPEVWAVIRAHNLEVAPVSPFALMAQSAKTLEPLVPAGRAALKAQGLVEGERINLALAAAVAVLCRPEECLSLMERGALGTLMRAFYGARDLFVGHVPLPGSHTIAFPYARGTIAGAALATLGLEAPAGSTPRG